MYKLNVIYIDLSLLSIKYNNQHIFSLLDF